MGTAATQYRMRQVLGCSCPVLHLAHAAQLFSAATSTAQGRQLISCLRGPLQRKGSGSCSLLPEGMPRGMCCSIQKTRDCSLCLHLSATLR